MDNRQELNRNLAQMLKGGVIMDVTTPEQAKIAEAAAQVCVPPNGSVFCQSRCGATPTGGSSAVS